MVEPPHNHRSDQDPSTHRPLRAVNTFGFKAESFATVIDQCDILSLDVFDTILARKALEPTDVFSWMETCLCLPGFANARVKAEQDARKRHRRRGAEVSLEEIYEAFTREITLPDDIMERELNAESRFLFGNPSVLDLIEVARNLGKRVIAISDIYLSSEQLDRLLKNAGVELDKVYTSSDFRTENIGKYNSKIFDHVSLQEGIEPGSFLHVGDNLVSDIANASKSGVWALWTRNLHEDVAVQDSIARFVSSRTRKPTDRIIVGHTNKISAFLNGVGIAEERLGYQFGGPLILGFLDFIQRTARSQGVERLVLFERDGCILAEAAKLLPSADIEMRLVPSSRRMTALPCLANGDPRPLFRLFPEPVSESRFFEALMLPKPQVLDDDGEQHRSSAKKHLERHQSSLMAQAEVELAALKAELQPELALLAKGGKVAWVDVGWSLSSASALNAALGVDVPCYCVGSNNFVQATLEHEGYLFKENEPADVSTAVNAGLELIELIFSAEIPSTAYLFFEGREVSRVVKPQQKAEFVRNISIGSVHRGVLRFIREIVDLQSGLDMNELRLFNQRLFRDLCKTPPSSLALALSRVPHDRLAGNQGWTTIGDYWKPVGYSDTENSSQVAKLQLELMNARSRPLKQFRTLLAFKLLCGLSRFSPPFPLRTVQRFAKSAKKLDPKRNFF